MSGKRGRPRIYAGKMDAQTGIRAPEAMIDAIYTVAQRHNTDVSTMTRAFWMRVLKREGFPLSENCEPSKDDALLTV